MTLAKALAKYGSEEGLGRAMLAAARAEGHKRGVPKTSAKNLSSKESIRGHALNILRGVVLFGGLIRDVICREIPLVLKGDLYATACIIGGATYIAAFYFGLSTYSCMSIGFAVTLTTRLAAMKWHWHLPVFNPEHMD